ncbi:hypothetical protein C2W64_01650 [Brevibacillus laterosporus]|nr:hypothetical protein C2W64_01650 [Brevibacillus laterosporus]
MDLLGQHELEKREARIGGATTRIGSLVNVVSYTETPSLRKVRYLL